MRAARWTERAIVTLGIILLISLGGLIASGVYLKWFYRPTESHAWGDIRTLHTPVTLGILIRNAHRWLGWLTAVTTPLYAILYAVAGISSGFLVRFRLLWAGALGVIILGLFGPSIVLSLITFKILSWQIYAVHMAPSFVLTVGLIAALLVRPRARGSLLSGGVARDEAVFVDIDSMPGEASAVIADRP